ncbi:GNAT family N-acetyltransferase [Dechloromonas sp. ARDL1]|uniref:GNAT family N-acetyltransferase n=1 Tax=Dechloromonas sp. ARDL1 TaxID=3322121 RepID=UPI003DA71713
MPVIARLRFLVAKTARKLFSMLPQKSRHNVYRSFVDCREPNKRLVLKIAETQEELEACFKLLHDAYVSSGFMTPDPSGMRVTIYHALPTTTTLCAKFDDQVVGTLSLIRESAIGFPLQRIFDLTDVREKEGQIAEVSALAVHPRFRRTGGTILFPLMKFMYEYCTTFFDTRHLVIAVNPRHIEMYESLLFFKRLTANMVENYDFVNGAPAVGATLDLKHAPEIMRKAYASKPPNRNLHRYFVETKLPNIQIPHRRFFTTNDPVMTPTLIDYFFNKRTTVFADLSDRKKTLLHLIYDLPEYKKVLPAQPGGGAARKVRQHQRFSVKCPAKLANNNPLAGSAIPVEVNEVSRYGFRARVAQQIPADVWLNATVQLGLNEVSRLTVQVVQETEMNDQHYCGFRIGEPDLVWRKFVTALYEGHTHTDLDQATRFLT